MKEDRTTRHGHWYDQRAGGIVMWGTVWRLKREYVFRDWRPAVAVGMAGLIGIMLGAWLAHLAVVVIYSLVLADLALAGIIWNTSRRR